MESWKEITCNSDGIVMKHKEADTIISTMIMLASRLRDMEPCRCELCTVPERVIE